MSNFVSETNRNKNLTLQNNSSIIAKMKVLLTGARGQLGTAIKRNSPKDWTIVEPYLDIGNPEVQNFIKDVKPNAVINCAAYTDVDKAEIEKTKAERSNVDGPKWLAESCDKLNIPLVHISSDYVFDGKERSPYSVNHRTNPINYYGKTKLLGEEHVRSICKKHIIVRLSWLFGDAPNKSNFVTKVMNWAKKNYELRIVDDQVSSPTYTDTATFAILGLMRKKLYGTWHVANSSPCSRFTWAKFIINMLDLPCNVLPAKSNEFPTRAKRPVYSVLDTSKTEEQLWSFENWQNTTLKYLTILNERGKQ